MVQNLNFWVFLFAGVGVYWMLPARFRAAFLGIASFGFVLAIEVQTALTMLAISGVIYGVFRTPLAESHKVHLVRAAILGLILYLGMYKYFPVIGQVLSGNAPPHQLLLPLGISYFTFKLIHYAIEMGRGSLPAHGFDDYLGYVFLVPIFTAGPIERFDHYITNRAQSWKAEYLTEGLTRIGHGLIKKFVLGAAIGLLMGRLTHGGGVGYLLDNLDDIATYRVIAYLILMYLFIYMDFSGYSDIAIGASRLFGLRIMENFNYPFLAPNIGNLWKRWHMSLANWCQSYVYMPMVGLSRNPYLAVISSFFVMGLWHAASLNWIAWGLYNAVGVMVFQKFSMTVRKKKWAFVKTRGFTVFATVLTFLYFAGSFAFTSTATDGGLYGAVRLLAKCFFITLPA